MRSKRSNDGEVSIETVMMMPVLLLLILLRFKYRLPGLQS
jgi:hypothetical protein